MMNLRTVLLLLTIVTFPSICVGQEGPDITQWLKDKIANHEPIKLPRGDYYITETIKLPGKYGSSIEGVGVAAAHLSATNPYNWQSTRIFWRGEPNEAMFRADGSYQTFKNLTLVGKPSHNAPTTAGVVGVKVLKARGLGTGKHRFESVWFQNLHYGTQWGESATGAGANCDESYFDSCTFMQCHSATRYEHSQALGFTYMNCVYKQVERCHDIQAGGHITAYKCFVSQPPSGKKVNFFHFTDEAQRRYRIGTSAGMITAYNLKVDYQSKENFRAVWMDSDVNGVTITFRDCQVSFTDYGKELFIKAGGPAKIVIDNCRFPGYTTSRYQLNTDDRGLTPTMQRPTMEYIPRAIDTDPVPSPTPIGQG